MAGFQGQGWGTLGGGAGLDRRGGDRGKKGRAREAEGREDQRALEAGGVREGTGWPGEKVC